MKEFALMHSNDSILTGYVKSKDNLKELDYHGNGYIKEIGFKAKD